MARLVHRTPPKRYSVLYIDAPWAYNDKNANGGRGSSFKYKVLTPADIISLPIQNVMADDCAVFMWTTSPMLHEAMHCLKAWGAPYKTKAFEWFKTNKKYDPNKAAKAMEEGDAWHWVNQFSKFGLGHWTRSSTESCLLGIKGRPQRVGKSVRQAIFYPALRHSAKPPETRDRIFELMGDVPRLEMFARERDDGWDATGLELDGVDVRDFLEG